MTKSTGKKAAGIATGIAVAPGVCACAWGLVWLMFDFLPKRDLGPVPWWWGWL